eukprot:146579-Amorphochlora_amoeboformis.AAC.1
MAALPLSLLAAVAFAARHSAPVNVLSETPETSSGVPVANGSSVNLVETKNPQIVIFRPFPWFTPDFEFVIDCTRSTDPCVFEVGDIAGNTYCLTIGSNPRECLGPAGPTYPQTFVLPGGVSYEGNGEVTGTIPPSGVLETRINHQTGVPLTPREQCGSQISSCKIINDPHVTTFGWEFDEIQIRRYRRAYPHALVTLVATSTRFKGEMFLNVNILSSTLARE